MLYCVCIQYTFYLCRISYCHEMHCISMLSTALQSSPSPVESREISRLSKAERSRAFYLSAVYHAILSISRFCLSISLFSISLHSMRVACSNMLYWIRSIYVTFGWLHCCRVLWCMCRYTYIILYTYINMCVCVCVCIYTYIYGEREKKREREI